MTSFSFSAIGTQWQIDIYNPLKEKDLKKVKSKVFERIEEFDATYSRFKDDSWVGKNRDFIGKSPLPNDIRPLLEIYQTLNKISEGKFTALIGRTLEEAGYDKDYSLKPRKLSKLPSFSESIGWDKENIFFKKKVILDFGAAGKGYLVDIVGKLLESEGTYNYCIDASGDILYKSQENEAIRIGLEDPEDPSRAIGVCELLNKSICGSAGNRRKWGKFHHTIDPLTLLSPSEVKAVWVVSETSLVADALTTCLYLDPNPERYKGFKYECVILYKDNSAYRSFNFPGNLFAA